jgi:CRM1 C terminal
VNTHCFDALFQIPPQHQKLVVDAVVWAFKHTERNIAETGLDILLELLQVCYYQNYTNTSNASQYKICALHVQSVCAQPTAPKLCCSAL